VVLDAIQEIVCADANEAGDECKVSKDDERRRRRLEDNILKYIVSISKMVPATETAEATPAPFEAPEIPVVTMEALNEELEEAGAGE